jgi:hypothetical protein
MGKGRESYLAMTVGSKLDCPVALPRTPDNAEVFFVWNDGANANVDWAVEKKSTRDVNFILLSLMVIKYFAR